MTAAIYARKSTEQAGVAGDPTIELVPFDRCAGCRLVFRRAAPRAA